MGINDLMYWFCGDELGQGQYRVTFTYGVNPKWVVKYERGCPTQAEQFCNATEYLIWEELKDTPLAKWLAPVRGISPCGIWLLQDRCQVMEKADRPKRVPEFLADLKPQNWGMLRGRPVCFDYGNHKLFTAAARRTKLITPKWVK
jgi:hypothetical protein